MKLRFRVDQSESFRRGVDCPKSIVTIEVNPSDLPQDERNLIADRLNGIDVCQGEYSPRDKRIIPKFFTPPNELEERAELIEADTPTYEGLLDALERDAARIQSKLK